MKLRCIFIFLLVSILSLSACGIVSGQPTKDPNATYTAATLSTLMPDATLTPGSPQPLTNGAIAGSVSSSGFPAVGVFAFSTTNFPSGYYYYTLLLSDQTEYILTLPGGEYYVVAYALAGGQPTDFVGGYTNAIPCGMGTACKDHSLATVVVADGATTTDISPIDFTKPASAYPPMPVVEALPAVNNIIQPLQDCKTIHDNASKSLQYRFTMIDAPYTDPVTGDTGMVCLVEADGTGVDFDALGIQGVVEALEATLTDWTYDPSLQADGPTGESRGYRRGTSLLVLSVSWQPTVDANCPKDQPISACVLAPEQKLYIITLEGRQ